MSARHPLRSAAGQEEDVAVLDLAGFVEERGEGGCDGGCVGAVLGEGLGRDKNEAGVRLAGGAAAGVEGHEVLDVGGDQGASGCCREGEYLIVGEREARPSPATTAPSTTPGCPVTRPRESIIRCPPELTRPRGCHAASWRAAPFSDMSW